MSNSEDNMLDPALMDDNSESDAPIRADVSDREPDTPLPVEPVIFPPLTPSIETVMETQDLEFLVDVDLEIAVELGRAKMSLREALALAPGAVIELDKLAGEPVDILVNNKLVGRGEVVVIEDMFGVRVTEVIPPSQRWKYR
ncbi:MAG: flagellar motor switch protein FliN [Anaerolineae bacterium]